MTHVPVFSRVQLEALTQTHDVRIARDDVVLVAGKDCAV